ISNLVFHLYERSVHPELFRVYAEEEVWQAAYSAVISICDAGHIITVRDKKNTVTEVTTTSEQLLPQRKRLIDRRLRGSRDESYHFKSGIHYQVSYQLEQLEPDVYRNLHEEFLIDCNRVNLSHRFPAGNRFSPEPLSIIRTEIAPRSLLIHAYHTFPESCAVVKTQSLFEL
ncbi:MAG: DUF2617 family protein, partial [Planctomycetes bacterium]|nr:DUF2617 family protein [Planctomycetota bacterium]